MVRFGLASILAFLVACGGGTKEKQCLVSSNCDLEVGGTCNVYESSGKQWCQYPDGACNSGRRWSDFETGDGLSGACVDDSGPDAGMTDAGSDASVVDAAPDARPADAATDAAVSDAAVSDAALPDAGPPPEMITIPEGNFQMGCSATTATCSRAAELPIHEVFIAKFEIDRLEVTQAQYESCVTSGPCTAPGGGGLIGNFGYNPALWPQHPAVLIDWPQAGQYCAWVGKRLPFEAEWEKAARGTDGRRFPWGNTSPTCALVQKAGCGDTASIVGSKPAGASPYGVLDMAGNAGEWVADYYDPDYYASSPNTNPQGPSTGAKRVVRGGTFGAVLDSDISTTARDSLAEVAQASTEFHGFRCARSL